MTWYTGKLQERIHGITGKLQGRRHDIPISYKKEDTVYWLVTRKKYMV